MIWMRDEGATSPRGVHHFTQRTEHTSWKQFSRQRSSPTSTPPALPLSGGALLDVDFTAYQGEYLGIIGHTGSGKSTLIQHLNGLLKPTSGQVLLQGTDIWTDPQTTRKSRFQVGLVFQYPEYQSCRRPSIRISPSA